MKTHRILYFLYALFPLLTGSCSSFLDEKPDLSLAVASTLDDFQRLMDNAAIVNEAYTGIGEEFADDHLGIPNAIQSLGAIHRNNYCFDNQETIGNQWSGAYRTIFYANLVLTGLKEIQDSKNEVEWQQSLEGTALFFSAFAYFHLAQAFIPYYDGRPDDNRAGLPLRTTASVDEKPRRATVADTYSYIMTQLNKAIDLLPTVSSIQTRPNKAAAYALKARICLTLAKYKEALSAAQTALQLHDYLIDFRSLDASAPYPFSLFNPEVLFQSRANSILLTPTYVSIHPELYALYHDDDLRKAIYFRDETEGTVRYKGYYDGIQGNSFFNGLTTGELFLIEAECLAREGRNAEALTIMDRLLSSRWKSADYQNGQPVGNEEVLEFILTERRKELVNRGLRWPDLRRLVKEGRYNKDIVREFSGEFYRFAVSDIPDFTFLFPINVVELGGYPQNRDN